MVFHIETEKDYGFLLKSLIAGGELYFYIFMFNNSFLFNYYMIKLNIKNITNIINTKLNIKY